MPEFKNVVKNFREVIVSQSHIASKPWQKREVKQAIQMLGSFLLNVLRDNQKLIRKFEDTAENTNNMEQPVRCKNQAIEFTHNGAECI